MGVQKFNEKSAQLQLDNNHVRKMQTRNETETRKRAFIKNEKKKKRKTENKTKSLEKNG